MDITFNQQKDSTNKEKHGVSLTDAANLEWDTLYATEDKRQDYGEKRMIGFALIKSRLFCVVYTDRGTTRRIISLRKANNREVRNYALNY